MIQYVDYLLLILISLLLCMGAYAWGFEDGERTAKQDELERERELYE